MASTPADLLDFKVDIDHADWQQCTLPGRPVRHPESNIRFLALDRSHCQAQSILFQIPIEILLAIVEQVPLESLSAFAQVSRACRHLARCRQFSRAYITQNPWSNGADLLSQLYREAMDESNGESRLDGFQCLTIGPYVRDLVYRTDLHEKGLDIRYPIVRLDYIQRRHAQSSFLSTQYSQILKYLSMAIQYAMPNLKKISLGDAIEIPNGLWKSLSRSQIERIEIQHFIAVGNTPLSTWEVAWPLKNLHVVLGNLREEERYLSQTTYASLLQLCGPTLQKITLVGTIRNHAEPLPAIDLDISFSFPHLREVILHGDVGHRGLYEAFLSPSRNLKVLSLHTTSTNASWIEDMCRRNLVYPVLSWLNLEAEYLSMSALESLLKSNPHIQSLCLRTPSHTGMQDQNTILQLLVESFHSLTNLVFLLKDAHFNDTSFYLLGKMHSLTSLWLGVTYNVLGLNPRIPLWELDHSRIRHAFRDLRNLNALGFQNETYSYSSSPEHPPSEYFERRLLEVDGASPYNDADDDTPLLEEDKVESEPSFGIPSNRDVAEMQRQVIASRFDINASDDWFIEHRYRMLRHGRNYFNLLPKLENLSIGKVNIGPSPEGRDRIPKLTP